MNIFGLGKTEEAINNRIRRNEIGDAYRQMQKSIAWRHLMDTMQKVKDDSIKAIDVKSVNDITANDTGWVKGRREAIDIILKEIEFVMGGI